MNLPLGGPRLEFGHSAAAGECFSSEHEKWMASSVSTGNDHLHDGGNLKI